MQSEYKNAWDDFKELVRCFVWEPVTFVVQQVVGIGVICLIIWGAIELLRWMAR